MGRAVAEAARARDGVELVAGFDRPGAPGGEWLGLVDREAALDQAEVVIDFTTADASTELAELCASRGGPALVIGSTGMTPRQEDAIRSAAGRVPIGKSGNYSLGVNVLLGLVRNAARLLPAGAYDIEVAEAHHRRKTDAPSGTALMLGQAAADGRGVALEAVAVRARDGVGEPRGEGQIGFSVLRGGGIVGEHSVLFAAEDEILTLSHSARDRSLFARGAIEAALWLRGRPPGLYDMQDVLGFGR